MEREQKKNNRFNKEIDKKVDRHLKEAQKLVKNLKMEANFGFNSHQTKFFETSLAYYILNKRSYEASYLSKQPDIQALAKIPIYGHIAKQITHINDVNDCAIRDLKNIINEQIKSYPAKEKLRPYAIRNAANYVSGIYIKCNESMILYFENEFLKKSEYIKTKILGV